MQIMNILLGTYSQVRVLVSQSASTMTDRITVLLGTYRQVRVLVSQLAPCVMCILSMRSIAFPVCISDT